MCLRGAGSQLLSVVGVVDGSGCGCVYMCVCVRQRARVCACMCTCYLCGDRGYAPAETRRRARSTQNPRRAHARTRTCSQLSERACEIKRQRRRTSSRAPVVSSSNRLERGRKSTAAIVVAAVAAVAAVVAVVAVVATAAAVTSRHHAQRGIEMPGANRRGNAHGSTAGTMGASAKQSVICRRRATRWKRLTHAPLANTGVPCGARVPPSATRVSRIAPVDAHASHRSDSAAHSPLRPRPAPAAGACGVARCSRLTAGIFPWGALAQPRQVRNQLEPDAVPRRGRLGHTQRYIGWLGAGTAAMALRALHGSVAAAALWRCGVAALPSCAFVCRGSRASHQSAHARRATSTRAWRGLLDTRRRAARSLSRHAPLHAPLESAPRASTCGTTWSRLHATAARCNGARHRAVHSRSVEPPPTKSTASPPPAAYTFAARARSHVCMRPPTAADDRDGRPPQTTSTDDLCR